MASKTELQKDLWLKQQRVSFWEKHHRLMPKENEAPYELMFGDPTAEFQDK